MDKNRQLAHEDHPLAGKKFPLSIIANDISSPLNVGSLFRLCDALGIKKLYLCGSTPCPPNDKIRKTSRSTEKHVNYETHDDAAQLLLTLKTENTSILSLEITTDSIDIISDEFRESISRDKQTYLILGAENTGVDEKLLALSDSTVHITMQGNNSSMNVITAAGIACYEITKNMQ